MSIVNINDYSLEDVVLMNNPELTKEMLEQPYVKCSSEAITMKRAMTLKDIDNVRVLLHYGSNIKTRRSIFKRELIDLINFDVSAARPFVEQLSKWDVIDIRFVQSLRLLFEQGSHETVEMLLEYNIDSFVKEKFGIELFISAFGNSKVNIKKLLKNHPFNIRSQENSGETALHCAVMNDVITNVNYLLKRGVNVNAKDCVGWTPLFIVKSIECMEILLLYGGDLQCIDKDNYTIIASLHQQSPDRNLVKTALANLAIDEARGKTVRQEILKTILSIKHLRTYYKRCHQEIKWMKRKNVFRAINYFTTICYDNNRIVPDMSKREIVNTLINKTKIMNGYVHSVLVNKLERSSIRRVISRKIKSVLGTIDDTVDPPCSTAAVLVDRSTTRNIVNPHYLTIRDIMVYIVIFYILKIIFL